MAFTQFGIIPAGPIALVNENISIDVGQFKWTGSEELPDSVEGEDHLWLITNLVDGKMRQGKK